MEGLIFFLLRFFRPLVNRSGADMDQVRLIVRYKLLMDNRKSLNPNSTKKDPNHSLWFQYFMYLLFGVIVAAIIGEGKSEYTALFFGYTFLIFMLSVNMIADFSTVLFDTRDNTIIIPRPVSEATYLLSRIVHISSYILGFTIAFAVIPGIVICFHYNPLAALIFVMNTLLSAVFAVFLTHLLYLGLMKVMSGERFKDIIAWFQIGITIFMMGGYQIMIRLVGKLEHVNLGTGKWWIHLLPPSWMAGSNEFFVSFHFTMFSGISILLSILVPLFGLWLVVKVLAPGYTGKLAVLEQGELIRPTEQSDKVSISAILARIFTRTHIESAVFQAVWKIAGRDRKFKQTVYPMLGSIFVMLFIFGFSGKSTIHELATTRLFLVLLYLPLFYLFIICISLKYSDNYRSAWIYRTIPVEQPGAVVSASIKAITLKLFVPVYLLCNAIMIYFQGIAFIFQIFTGLMISLTGLLFILSLFRLDLPFSTDPSNRSAGGNLLLTFILVPLGGVMAGLHYAFLYFNIPMALVSLGAGVLCWFVFGRFRKTGWKKMEPIDV